MIDIKNYIDDGAHWQAQAVLAYIRYYSSIVTDIKKDNGIKVEIKVGRYENCREQGYIFTLYYGWKPIMNYCVYQHRNNDQLCVLKFKTECNINTPTLEDVWKDKKDKYDVDKFFEFGEIVPCGDFIMKDMENYITGIIEKPKQEKV